MTTENAEKNLIKVRYFIPTPFDEEAYKDYYDDGYTPTATVLEDLSYA